MAEKAMRVMRTIFEDALGAVGLGNAYSTPNDIKADSRAMLNMQPDMWGKLDASRQKQLVRSLQLLDTADREAIRQRLGIR